MSGKGTIGQVIVKGDHDMEWKIANFFSYTRQNGCYYFSPFFTLSNDQWYFQMYPNGHEGYEGWMSWYLFTYSSTRVPGATFYFGIKKSDGSIHKMGPNKSWIFGDRGPGFGYPAFLNVSELDKEKSEMAPMDTLTLTCSLWGYKDFDSTAKTRSLSNNLLDMFISERACDVSLQVKHSAKFSAHKFILMARSPVFAAMFETPMKEKGTGLVKIDDCDPVAFFHFLVYLYSGRLEHLSRHMFELYKIADKYDVDDLKSDCLIALMGNLTVENFFDVVNLAWTFSEYALQIKAEHFFCRNYAEIFLTKKWESFMKEEQKLANALLISMAKYHSRRDE